MWRVLLLALGLIGVGATAWVVWPIGTGPVGAGAGAPTGERPFPEALPPDTPTSNDPWLDPAWLVAHLERACDAVEHVCGRPFHVRPGVAVGNRDWVLGWYERESLTVHVSKIGTQTAIRDGLDRAALRPDTLRIILVHEVVHAWDSQHNEHLFPGPASKEGVFAWDSLETAMVEGHAQHVARIVAEKWWIPEAFRVLRHGFIDWGGRVPRSERMRQDTSWRNYVRGQEFLDRLEELGGRTLVDDALSRPPRDLLDLADPERWIRWNAQR